MLESPLPFLTTKRKAAVSPEIRPVYTMPHEPLQFKPEMKKNAPEQEFPRNNEKNTGKMEK